MPDRPRRLVLLVALAVLAAGVVVGYVVWPRATTFEQALARLPADTLRVSWTHWAGLRDELDAEGVSGEAGQEFLAEATERDLVQSSLAASSEMLAEGLGLNPMATEWELLGQGRDGMVLLIGLGDLDVGALAERFAELGYQEPDEDALAGAVWIGGPNVVSDITGLATYELQHVAFLEEEGLLVASESADFLAGAVPAATGEQEGLEPSPLTDPVSTPLAAIGLLEDYACEALSMARAGEDAQALADTLVEEAGGVTAVTGYLVALGRDRAIDIVFDFEDADRAEKNQAARAALARAEDPAQFLAYPELFTLKEVTRDDTVLVLSGQTEAGLAPLTNLSTGPVLLASC